MNLPQIAAIVLIAFFIGEVVKRTPLDDKWIPVICGFVGGVLGIVGRTVIPELANTNWIDALAIGIASGLSATGAHQIYKQLFVNDPETQNGDK